MRRGVPTHRFCRRCTLRESAHARWAKTWTVLPGREREKTAQGKAGQGRILINHWTKKPELEKGKETGEAHGRNVPPKIGKSHEKFAGGTSPAREMVKKINWAGKERYGL